MLFDVVAQMAWHNIAMDQRRRWSPFRCCKAALAREQADGNSGNGGQSSPSSEHDSFQRSGERVSARMARIIPCHGKNPQNHDMRQLPSS